MLLSTYCEVSVHVVCAVADMVRWCERHPSEDDEQYAVFQKVFVGQLISSGTLLTLVFAKLPNGGVIPLLSTVGVLNVPTAAPLSMQYMHVSALTRAFDAPGPPLPPPARL